MITPSGSDPFLISPPIPGKGPGGVPTPTGLIVPPASSSPMTPPSTKSGGCVGCGGKSSVSSNNFSNSNSLQNSMNSPVQSWYDVPLQQPVDPRILIANSYIGATQGSFSRSSNYAAAGWAASPLAYSGTAVCTTLHTD